MNLKTIAVTTGLLLGGVGIGAASNSALNKTQQQTTNTENITHSLTGEDYANYVKPLMVPQNATSINTLNKEYNNRTDSLFLKAGDKFSKDFDDEQKIQAFDQTVLSLSNLIDSSDYIFDAVDANVKFLNSPSIETLANSLTKLIENDYTKTVLLNSIETITEARKGNNNNNDELETIYDELHPLFETNNPEIINQIIQPMCPNNFEDIKKVIELVSCRLIDTSNSIDDIKNNDYDELLNNLRNNICNSSVDSENSFNSLKKLNYATKEIFTSIVDTIGNDTNSLQSAVTDKTGRVTSKVHTPKGNFIVVEENGNKKYYNASTGTEVKDIY